MKAPGLRPRCFHDLRHTAATILLCQDIHLKSVSEMLGHSSIALTLDTYSHVLTHMQSEAAGSHGRCFGSGLNTVGVKTGVKPEKHKTPVRENRG